MSSEQGHNEERSMTFSEFAFWLLLYLAEFYITDYIVSYSSTDYKKDIVIHSLKMRKLRSRVGE